MGCGLLGCDGVDFLPRRHEIRETIRFNICSLFRHEGGDVFVTYNPVLGVLTEDFPCEAQLNGATLLPFAAGIVIRIPLQSNWSFSQTCCPIRFRRIRLGHVA